jgi:transcriptional regulator with XRE-family HTH domain
MTVRELLRVARHRHGVSQRELARRAGTTQSAISRIETEGVSPTIATLDELLFLLGEELVLEARPIPFPAAHREAIRERLAMTLDERLKRGLEESQAILDEQRYASEERG